MLDIQDFINRFDPLAFVDTTEEMSRRPCISSDYEYYIAPNGAKLFSDYYDISHLKSEMIEKFQLTDLYSYIKDYSKLQQSHAFYLLSYLGFVIARPKVHFYLLSSNAIRDNPFLSDLIQDPWTVVFDTAGDYPELEDLLNPIRDKIREECLSRQKKNQVENQTNVDYKTGFTLGGEHKDDDDDAR